MLLRTQADVLIFSYKLWLNGLSSGGDSPFYCTNTVQVMSVSEHRATVIR
ncbi:hypothetical protein FLA_2016 [Filimonas lacunae]|nr:hypothetical protein FLA_2016 [Filimonas lacunae]